MCYDYDWCAEVEVVLGKRGLAERCIDCGSRIAPDEWRLHVYQQEHEECRVCAKDGECEDEDHDYGVTFECHICRECCEWREAVRSVEIEAGCREFESQPAYGELLDAIYEDCSGRYAWAHYSMRKPIGLFIVTLRDGRHCETVLAHTMALAGEHLAIKCSNREITTPLANVTHIALAREGDKEEVFDV